MLFFMSMFFIELVIRRDRTKYGLWFLHDNLVTSVFETATGASFQLAVSFTVVPEADYSFVFRYLSVHSK